MSRIDAIVLDLDDTLIDTSGTLIEPAHRAAAQAMVDAGLRAPVEAVARARIDVARGRPDRVDEAVAKHFAAGTDEERVAAIAAAGRDSFLRPDVDAVAALPGARETVAALRGAGFRLFLLTTGDVSIQRRKADRAGFADGFVDRVFVPPDGADKRAGLRQLIRYHQLDPARTLVVGDRVDREIAAGRLAGCWTVRVLRGEGESQRPEAPEQQPHYSVPSVEALADVIADIDANDDSP
jgi:FMN phosphatase YigB (HAD superfamily)